MKIDHVALYVRDLEAAKEFFAAYLGGRAGEEYHNPKTGLRSYFLALEEGARLEIMTRPQVEPAAAALYGAGYTHLSFSLGSRERVGQLTATLKEKGYPVISGPRVTGDGYYESCVLGSEGSQIELTQ